MDWFRMYSEARNDAKLRALTDAQHRTWFNLLCFAAEQQEGRGSVAGYDLELLAVEVAGGDVGLLTETLERLQRLRIITVDGEGTITFINFDKRNYNKPSDTPEETRERKRRQRDRERMSRDVTPGHAIDTDKQTDTQTDPDIDPDIDIKTTTAQSAAAAPDKPPTNKELIDELATSYRAIEGIQATKGDHSFIGALYNKHGYERVLDGINELQMAAATQELKKPLLYLKGILEPKDKGGNGSGGKPREPSAGGQDSGGDDGWNNFFKSGARAPAV